ncbi:MAG: glycogen/starch/alpha-glucan phosphorylase, partial [Verrucomicrobiota bacterium]
MTQPATAAAPESTSQRFMLDSSPEGLQRSILNHLRYTLALHPEGASQNDWWNAVCFSLRDRILQRSSEVRRTHAEINARRLYYFSMEYLMGRLLDNNLRNMGLWEPTRQALVGLGQDLPTILDEETDMGLGNGGLGRLAACFLDSLATLNLPAVGYG